MPEKVSIAISEVKTPRNMKMSEKVMKAYPKNYCDHCAENHNMMYETKEAALQYL